MTDASMWVQVKDTSVILFLLNGNQCKLQSNKMQSNSVTLKVRGKQELYVLKTTMCKECHIFSFCSHHNNIKQVCPILLVRKTKPGYNPILSDFKAHALSTTLCCYCEGQCCSFLKCSCTSHPNHLSSTLGEP